jgi:hypothetical protein
LKRTTRPAVGTIDDSLPNSGFAVRRGLLPADEVEAVRRDLAGVYAAHGWLAEENPPDALVPDTRRRDGAPGWWRFAEDVQRTESFHRLAHHPALLAWMSEISGPKVLNHPRRHLTTVNPQFWVPAHQEYTHIQGAVDFFTAFVPLTPFAAGGGTLRVLNETGTRTVRALRILPTRGVEADVDESGEWHELELEPGDVVVMHSLTTRCVTENVGNSIQLAAQYRFQSSRLPVVKASLKPEHYPRLPDWPAITKGWSSRRWIVPPLMPKLVDYQMPVELESWHEDLASVTSDYFTDSAR